MDNEIISKSNTIIWSRHDLSLIEQKLVLFAISKLSKIDFISRFTVVEFLDSIDCITTRHSEIKQKVENLKDKELSFFDKTLDNKIVYHKIKWCDKVICNTGGIVELRINKLIIPHFLWIKNDFSIYKLKNIMKLRKKYAIRLYEILNVYPRKRKQKFLVKELRTLLADSDSYKRFADFENRVIIAGIEEINSKTDIFVTYTKTKRGRSVWEIEFKIKKST